MRANASSGGGNEADKIKLTQQEQHNDSRAKKHVRHMAETLVKNVFVGLDDWSIFYVLLSPIQGPETSHPINKPPARVKGTSRSLLVIDRKPICPIVIELTRLTSYFHTPIFTKFGESLVK